MKMDIAVRRLVREGVARGAHSAQRVLIVDDDPATLHQLTDFMDADPALEPVGAGTAEEALRILSAQDGVDCLLVDVAPPGTEGLRLLLSARELRPNLRIVAMASSATDELYRAVLESGATRLLSKPLDFEDLLNSLGASPPGSLSYLEGDLDLMDVCRLSAACQSEGGVRVWQGQREGILAHHGAALVHATADGLAGVPAVASLRSWSHWRFESLPALSTSRLVVNCELEMAADVQRREGARSGGHLRGLTLRHLIEWAMRGRQTCSLMVTSRHRTGILSFEAGKILSAETAEQEGARAAAEILRWENVRVDLRRSAQSATSSQAGKRDGLQELIERFCGEIEGFIATSIVCRESGLLVGGQSTDPLLPPAAAVCFAGVVESHLAAVEHLGVGTIWGETEDILITLAKAYLLIRLLGDGHYHWLAVSNESNLALCRLVMRSYDPFLRTALEDLGEIPC